MTDYFVLGLFVYIYFFHTNIFWKCTQCFIFSSQPTSCARLPHCAPSGKYRILTEYWRSRNKTEPVYTHTLLWRARISPAIFQSTRIRCIIGVRESNLSGNNNYPHIYSIRPQPESILSISSEHKLWKHHHIRRSCSAAAKWKRKFSVTGGKWCCFKPSSVILESSHSSARATKLVRISFVLTEISCGQKGVVILDSMLPFVHVNAGKFGATYLNNLTIWLLRILCRLHDEVTDVFV